MDTLSISLGYVVHKLWRRYTTSCEQAQPHIHAKNRNPDSRYGTAPPATCMPFAVPALFSVLSQYERGTDYSVNFTVLQPNRYRAVYTGRVSGAGNPKAGCFMIDDSPYPLSKNCFSLVPQTFKLDTTPIQARHTVVSRQIQRDVHNF